MDIVLFNKEGGKIIDQEGKIVVTASEINGIYKVNEIKEKNQINGIAYCAEDDGLLWHRRMGHLNRKSLSILHNETIGITSKKILCGELCQSCLEGKQSRFQFNHNLMRSNDKLDLIHIDLCGPMETESYGSSRYIMTLVDDYSRKMLVYFLSNKYDVSKIFEEFKNLVERQTGKRIKKVRSDNGTEFVSHVFENMLKRSGIVHQKTVCFTPQQNGVAERANRTIVEKARTMLCDAKLPKEYWAEAANTAVYLINRSPSKILNYKTPYEVWKVINQMYRTFEFLDVL